jgi:hypothetical protein
MLKSKHLPLTGFLGAVVLTGLVALLGPAEQTLGPNVRVVYLHGAWVLTAEAAFAFAGLSGLIGLVRRSDSWHAWSAALGRTGIVFWLTSLPLSLWAMETNWNGLFLAEPRFRLALTFAVTGLLLQVGLWVIRLNWLTSAANLLFVVVLRAAFATAGYVMHPPPSPIFGSGDWRIIAFFILLNLLAWLAAFFLTIWWRDISNKKEPA